MPRTVPAASPSVSAAGASYGLTNGRGAINGTGLVNGTGITNGAKAGGRLPPGSKRHGALATRWQFLSVLIVLVVVVSSFVYLSYASENNSVTIDGRFNDWSHVGKFTMNTDATTSTINVDQWAVRTEASRLYLYLKVQGVLMGSSNVDSFYLFVDFDDYAQTGYVVSGLGADYLLEIDGWNGSVQSTALSRYGSPSDQHNWTSWTDIGSLSTALASSQLEAMADMSLSLGPDARYLLLSQNALDEQSISYVVPKDGGTLIVHQEAVSSSMPNGAVPYSSNMALLRLSLLAEGAGGTVQNISPIVRGARLVSYLGPVTLKAGQEQTLDVMIDTSASTAGSLVSVSVSRLSFESDFTDVSIVGEPAKAYVVAPPSTIVIDGAFGDWVGRISADTDSLPVLNPDIDINATGAVNSTLASYFYVSVKGQMCNGSFVPTIKMKPTGGSGGGGRVVPTRITGEDLLRIYIDSDRNISTGVPTSMSSKVIGADYLVEIVGMDGVIDRRSLMVYQGGVWTLVPSATIDAANDAQRIEIGVLSTAIGGSSSIEFIIETTDWRGRWDMATSLPQTYKGSSAGAMAAGIESGQGAQDIAAYYVQNLSLDPWAMRTTGADYRSPDGVTWSAGSTITLSGGDNVIDMAPSWDKLYVFAVTNSGRVYSWHVGVSTTWGSNVTDTINGTANIVAIAPFDFAVSSHGGCVLASDGRLWAINKLDGTQRAWTYGNKVADGITDFADIEYQKTGQNYYVVRSASNTAVYYSNSAANNWYTTAATGSTSPQTHILHVGASKQINERILVLCRNGNIRDSSDGGATWSARGNLPAPGGSNTSFYIGMDFDPAGYLWVIRDAGWCYKSTDTTTLNSFTYTGRATSAGGVTAITCPIPEFSQIVVPIVFMMSLFVLIMGRTRRNRKV